MGQGQEGSDRGLRGLHGNAKGSRKREGQTMEEKKVATGSKSRKPWQKRDGVH